MNAAGEVLHTGPGPQSRGHLPLAPHTYEEAMRTLSLFATSAALAAPLLFSTQAQAAGGSLAACGDIHVEAEAECSVEASGGCEAQCTPLSVTAACAADLQAECSGGCTADIDASCTASCQGSCMAECEVDPGAFECAASCSASCGGECSARCDAMAGDGEARAECEASCQAECDASCDASCNIDLPEADCMASCDACCGGECQASANFECQVDCQASLYAECKADIQGGCELACEKPEGALFCDGNYVDHGGNLEECVGALQALFNIMVSGYAEGECSGNMCQGEAGGSVSCSVNPEGVTSREAALALVLSVGLLGIRRRRRRRWV